MRLDRLLEIVIILLNRRQITARELADRFEVSVRTIYRDIEAINLAGVPVVSTQGQGGGFTVLDTFRIDRQVLTLDDMASIAAALRGVHDVLADPDLRRALEKITALVPGERSGEFAARSEMLVIRPNPTVCRTASGTPSSGSTRRSSAAVRSSSPTATSRGRKPSAASSRTR
jgi:predicted DNA-binding transcriptional regulator YafY